MKFAENQKTFRKALKMRMCKIVIRLPCIYSLFLEMKKCECNTVSPEVRGAWICFLTWIRVYIQRYIILLRNWLSEKYREYSKGAWFAIYPGKIPYLLLQPSLLKAGGMCPTLASCTMALRCLESTPDLVCFSDQRKHLAVSFLIAPVLILL